MRAKHLREFLQEHRDQEAAAAEVGILYPGGGYGSVVFHKIRRDPHKCNSSRQQGIVHSLSVPPQHHSTCFSGEGRIPLISISTSSPAVVARRLLYSSSTARMERPSRLSLCWSRPGYQFKGEFLVE